MKSCVRMWPHRVVKQNQSKASIDLGPPGLSLSHVRTGRFLVVDSIKPRYKKKGWTWPSGVEGWTGFFERRSLPFSRSEP